MKLFTILLLFINTSVVFPQPNNAKLILSFSHYHNTIVSRNDNDIFLKLENVSRDSIIIQPLALQFIRVCMNKVKNDTVDSKFILEHSDNDPFTIPVNTFLSPGEIAYFKVGFDFIIPPKKGKYRLKYFIDTRKINKIYNVVETPWITILNKFDDN